MVCDRRSFYLMPTFLRWVGGIAVGAFVWWYCVITYSHDDDITRTGFGLIVAFIFSTGMLVVGLPLRFASVARVWWRLRLWLFIAVCVEAAIMLFSNSFGLTHAELDPEVGYTIDVFNWSSLPILTHALLIFSIVNWPKKPSEEQRQS
jgi:hypothetical protein